MKPAPRPFEKYIAYPPSVNSEGRKIVSLVPLQKHKEKLRRTSISYARFLMSIELGRELAENEEVDHIDGDKTNDIISNLQVLSPTENRKKQLQELSVVRKMVLLLQCPNCGKVFERARRQTHLAKNGVFTSCSRSCGGKLRAQLQAGHDLSKAIAANILKEYEEASSYRGVTPRSHKP